MKYKVYILKIVILVFSINASAQSTIEIVLKDITKNNKTIVAKKQFGESQKIQYQTGLTLTNPIIEYDFLVGSPSGAGVQHDFSILQSFDYPKVYGKKKDLSKLQTSQVEIQSDEIRQNVLLEANLIFIELVYRNKLQHQLTLQKQNTEKLWTDFKVKLDKGEGNMLDVNKTQIQLVEIKKQFQENESNIIQLNEKLTSINGGIQIEVLDTIYPLLKDITSFEQFEAVYEENDPQRKILEQQILISLKQIEVSKAMKLPKFEFGYHYQGILGQNFNGVHTGISIPLWENKNTVELQESRHIYANLELQDHRNEHYYEIKQLYEKYTNLKITLNEYQTIFATFNNTSLLKKALALGQISTIEYFMETNYFNAAFNNYLQTEMEYHQTIAELFKYQL